jgi:pilus assembly protein CpaC
VASQLQAAINRPPVSVTGYTLAGVTARAVGRTIFLEGEVSSPEELARLGALARAFGQEVQTLVTVRPAPPPPPGPSGAALAADSLRAALTAPGITVRVLSDRSIAVEGLVPNAAEAERVRRLVTAAAQGIEVVDLLTVPAPEPPTKRQVYIRTRVIDINKRRTRTLGIVWGPNPITFAEMGDILNPPFEQLFNFGPIGRVDPITAQLTALANESAARVLSEPNLTILEGETGNILIGGEFPYPTVQTTTSGDTNGAITVAFKQFGISLAVTANQITEDEVTMRVAPMVSSLDFQNAVQMGGFTVPALRTRQAQTTVRIQGGQTLAIGGLISDEYGQSIQKIPFLSDIPVIGDFFKNKDYQRGLTELVILVTPEILGPGQVPSTPAPSNKIRTPQVPIPRI